MQLLVLRGPIVEIIFFLITAGLNILCERHWIMTFDCESEDVMLDLWLALAIMTGVSIVIFFCVCRLCREISRWARRIFASLVIAAIIVFSLWLIDSRWILQILPLQAAIIYGNFLIPLSAMAAAVLWEMRRKSAWRRIIFMVPLVILAYGYSLVQMLAPTPPAGDKWSQGVYLQTRQSSCAAAAAATLLAYHGIGSSEREMARLCLTSDRGTFLHGLYRGLCIKIKNQPLSVVVRGGNFDDLLSEANLPVLVYVKLTPEIDQKDPRYARDWGWIVGVIHTVVLFDFTNDGRAMIGDPGVGREFWDVQVIKDLWQGQYITLEEIQ